MGCQDWIGKKFPPGHLCEAKAVLWDQISSVVFLLHHLWPGAIFGNETRLQGKQYCWNKNKFIYAVLFHFLQLYVIVVFRQYFRFPLHLLLQPLEQDEKNRNDKHSQDGTDKQSSNCPRTNRTVSCGSNSSCEHQWHQPNNKCKGGHQDGT